MSDEPIANPHKKVDTDWLDRVEAEKKTEPTPKKEEPKKETPKENNSEVNFTLFLTTLGLQAFVALGELEDPVSHKKKVNLEQARYMIDMIKVIQEKTRGNLTPTEEKTLGQLTYELQVKYVERSKQTS